MYHVAASRPNYMFGKILANKDVKEEYTIYKKCDFPFEEVN